VRVEAVPFARHRSGFTRDFEDLVASLATKTDKTTITRLSRLDWDSVGRICSRVVADGLDPARLDGLVRIGVDEVSWKRHHHYLTLVADHDTKKIVWGAPGRTPPPSTPPAAPSRLSSCAWPARTPAAATDASTANSRPQRHCQCCGLHRVGNPQSPRDRPPGPGPRPHCCPPFVLHMTAPLPMTMERRSTSCAIVTLAA